MLGLVPGLLGLELELEQPALGPVLLGPVPGPVLLVPVPELVLHVLEPGPVQPVQLEPEPLFACSS